MHPNPTGRQDSVLPQKKRPHREETDVELIKDFGTAPKVSSHHTKTLTEPSMSRSGRETEDLIKNKRAKFGKSPQRTADTLETRREAISYAMLSNFPSSPNNSNFIDLTGSPSPSRGPALSAFSRNKGAKPALQQNDGAKRLVVKNLRQTPTVDLESYFQQIWSQLEEALELIFAGKAPNRSYEESYRRAESLCRQGGASRASEKLRRKCAAYVKGPLKAPLTEQILSSDIEILRTIVEAWSRWQIQVEQIRSIFYYLDRSYLLPTKHQRTIEEMATKLFKENVINDIDHKSKMLEGICDLCDLERVYKNDQANSVLLRQGIDMIRRLDAYTQELEPVLVRRSTLFFKIFAEEKAIILPEYVVSCRNLIANEEDLYEFYNFDISTHRELAQCRDEAIVRQKKEFLSNHEAVFHLLDSAAIQVISLLFDLLESVNLELALRSPWEAYIKKQGSAIVEDKDRQTEMVVRLLEFRMTLDKIWSTAFKKQEQLDSSLRDSFATFINERKKGSSTDTNNSKAGEMIAKHMDMLLRGGMKAIPMSLRTENSKVPSENATAADAAADEDAELNAQLDLALDLFRFIEGKDVFEAFYKNDLSKRLLMSRSASDDAEKSMLGKLRTECGAGFTYNLEQMFRDIDLSKDEMTSYKALRRNTGKADSIDLNVNILSSASWPTFTEVPLKLPQEIAIAIDHYDRHYKSKHSGRILSWKHDLAHCNMRAQFPKGAKEIVLSSAQAVVILLFNDVPEKEKLTYSQILSASGLPEEKLKVTLQSLACAMYRVLSKHPKGRDVNHTDTFSINTSFTDPKYRIKINQIQMKETKAENKATHEQVAKDRQYETQAAIVRIMKGRKTIKHAELVSEVITQTKKRGHLEVREIKTQIDKLIDKDFLERDGSNGYTYLA